MIVFTKFHESRKKMVEILTIANFRAWEFFSYSPSRVNVENLDVKSAQANELILRAEKNTKRRWKNGWKKPQLLKAGKYYTNAAELFCQNFHSGNIFSINLMILSYL